MSLREYLQNNFWLKLSSLALALLIWFSVRFSKQDLRPTRNPLSRFSTSEIMHVPVRVIWTPEAAEACKVEPAQVDITLRGEKSALKNLTAKDIVAFVTVNDDPAVGVSSNRVEVYTPPAVSVVQVSPAGVRIEHFHP
jgi:YbbR domain-containing protein